MVDPWSWLINAPPPKKTRNESYYLNGQQRHLMDWPIKWTHTMNECSVISECSERQWLVERMSSDIISGKVRFTQQDRTTASNGLIEQVNRGGLWDSLITRSCVLGVTCNKPMRVPSSISSKSQRIWTWRVDILTSPLQSPLRQMHDHISNFKWLSLWPNNIPNSHME